MQMYRVVPQTKTFFRGIFFGKRSVDVRRCHQKHLNDQRNCLTLGSSIIELELSLF